MKTLRTTVTLLNLSVYIIAIYLLICDPRWNSLWVAGMISVPVGMMLFCMAKGIAIVVNDPTMLVNSSKKDMQKLAREITGPKDETWPLMLACTAAQFFGGGYMMWAGLGLTGCDAVFLVLHLTGWALRWLDSTQRGRTIAVRLGIPLTSEDEIIID